MAPESKKRKRDHGNGASAVDTSKPTAVFTPGKGRPYTVSVALPSSIIAKSVPSASSKDERLTNISAQTHEQKTALAGTLARAFAVFCVDEVVIFADGPSSPASSTARHNNPHAADDAASGYTAFSDPAHFLEHLLSYLETPPHLRRVLFPHHPNLRTAGSLQSVDMPHHLKVEEWCAYREGVASAPFSEANGGSGKKAKKEKKGEEYTTVNTGLPNPVVVPGAIPPHARVTVKFDDSEPPTSTASPLRATAVAPSVPREEAGYYWGYTVRQAASLSGVFTEAPWQGGYDFCVGTSERGVTLAAFMEEQRVASAPSESDSSSDSSSNSDSSSESDADEVKKAPQWRHLLLTFGGVAGLENALTHDQILQTKGIEDPKDLFDAYVNLVPQQGSRTIRTEEAVWCGLMGLRGWVLQNDV
ncbi:hypothetical protein FH972_024242 [Carpinus fangiana]|uniref:DUF171-domain-containing protein n=1 Tax=Carpinus fangiana TaxID=176857 RepID=A0A5N6KXV2_9ROSI|nr:hypothetical protein FH972_024242 [Carpinus fangiana]